MSERCAKRFAACAMAPERPVEILLGRVYVRDGQIDYTQDRVESWLGFDGLNEIVRRMQSGPGGPGGRVLVTRAVYERAVRSRGAFDLVLREVG
jgi:hypothetical protein